MKYETKSDGILHVTTATAETLADELALGWIKDHVPLVAGTEPYGISAYLAGFAACEKIMKEKETLNKIQDAIKHPTH